MLVRIPIPIWLMLSGAIAASLVSLCMPSVRSIDPSEPETKAHVAVLVDTGRADGGASPLPAAAVPFLKVVPDASTVMWTASFNASVLPESPESLAESSTSTRGEPKLNEAVELAERAFDGKPGPKALVIWLNRADLGDGVAATASRLFRKGWLIAVYGSSETVGDRLREVASGNDLAFRDTSPAMSLAARRAALDLDRMLRRLWTAQAPGVQPGVSTAVGVGLLSFLLGAFAFSSLRARDGRLDIGPAVGAGALAFGLGALGNLAMPWTGAAWASLGLAVAVGLSRTNPDWVTLAVTGLVGAAAGLTVGLESGLLLLAWCAALGLCFGGALVVFRKRWVDVFAEDDVDSEGIPLRSANVGRADVRIGASPRANLRIGTADRLNGTVRMRGNVAYWLESDLSLTPLMPDVPFLTGGYQIVVSGDVEMPPTQAVIHAHVDDPATNPALQRLP